MENNTFPSPPTVKRANGCFFAILVFLSSCFVGLILLLVLIFFLLSASVKKITDKPLDSVKSYKENFYSGEITSSNKIVLINIKGIIQSGNDSWNSIADSNEICDKLSIAEEDKKVKAVILDIDSPGGEITATDKIYHYIQKIKQKNIPIVAVMEAVAASGGYYAAVGADCIIANRLTTTGSIGVIINSFNYYKLLEKIGITDEVYKSKEMKDLLNPARPRTSAEKEIIQNLINDSYNEFVKVVATNRQPKNPKLTVNYIENSEIGDGRIFSGQQALKLGLIDKLGYLEDGEDEAAKLASLKQYDYKIVTYDEKLSVLSFLQKFMLDNFSLKVYIPGLKQFSSVEPGKFYYLYTTQRDI